MKKRISKVILATALLFGSVATNIKASEKVNFVAIGDSITTGYGLPGYREPDAMVNPPVLAYAKDSFVEVLKETKSFNTTNFGADGITSDMLLVGFQLMSDPQKDIIREADVISVTIGGNDLLSRFMGDIATKLGIDPSDTAAIVAVLSNPSLQESLIIGMVLNDIKNDLPNMVQKFSSNFNTIIQNVKAINPDGKIIVQTIANPYKDLSADPVLGGMALAIEAGLQEFNGVIRGGAAKGAYSFADVYDAFNKSVLPGLTNATNPATPLDPHPSYDGHAIIATIVLDAMASMYSPLVNVQNTFTPITDLENGVPKTVEGLKLPTKTTVEVTQNKKLDAEIAWDLTNCKYDPALKTAQKFTVKGTVVLPKFITNDDDASLEVSIEVNVKAAKEEPAKPAEPSVPEKKPETVDEIKKTPDTSDTTSLVALSISALVACGAMLVLKYRKNSKAVK